MCYFVSIASPLTLSEVRSMLPPGITADPRPSAELVRIRPLLPAAQTVAYLLVGSCSCDLVRPRLPDARDDERHLRARYRTLGLPRERIIRELERHRRSEPAATPSGGWGAALAAFVAEHARNAGPTLFRLRFLPGRHEVTGSIASVTRTVAEVRDAPEPWLEEDRPILVLR